MLQLRVASIADAESMLQIYAPHIRDGAFTFETALPSVEQFAQRVGTCLERFPWLLCEENGVVGGYVYASAHRDREAYQWTTECSVYVSEAFRGRGVARRLYAALFALLKLQGIRSVYAGITLPNEPSVSLHEKCGFRWFATYDHVGYKLGAWHNVGWWKLQLNGFDLQPPPPLTFREIPAAQLDAILRGVELPV